LIPNSLYIDRYSSKNKTLSPGAEGAGAQPSAGTLFIERVDPSLSISIGLNPIEMDRERWISIDRNRYREISTYI